MNVLEKYKTTLGSLFEKVKVSVPADQLLQAGRGLWVRLSDGTTLKFDELVKAGEFQLKEGKPLVQQLKDTVSGPFGGTKSGVNTPLDQFKLATLGLVIKAQESSQKYFNELVQLGQTQSHQASSTTTK